MPARTCACAHVCVCVCVDVHLSVAPRAPACVFCIVFIFPASISAKLKFCIALCIYIDYEATAARSFVSCVKYDYRYRDSVKMWFVLWMSLFD